MIVSGGVKIYPAEIEVALLSSAGVTDCAVFGVPDQEFGEAVVGMVAGSGVDAETLRRELGKRIARYKIPRTFAFVPTIDRDPSGKIRKATLRNRYLASGSGSHKL